MNQTSFIKLLKIGGIIMLTLICNDLSSANEPIESVTTVNLSDRWPSWKVQYLEKGVGISLAQAGPIGFHDVHIRFLSGKHTMEVEFCTALFQVSELDVNDEDEWSTSSGWLALPAGYSKAQISEKQWKQMMELMKQAGIKPALSTTTRATKAAVTVGRWHSCIFDLEASDSDVLLQLLLVFYADIPRTEKIELSESSNAGASKP
jgi:hypothetical protein